MIKILKKITQNHYLGILILFIFGLIIFSPVSSASFNLPFDIKELIHIDPRNDGSGSGDLGADMLSDGIMMVVEVIRAIAGSVAVLIIVIMGMQMVTAGGNEEQATKAKKGVTWAFVSLGLLLMVEPMIRDVLYRSMEPDIIKTSIAEGTRQIMAFLECGKALVITVAMMYLILSGWKMIQALGNQEVISNQKQVFLWIAVGLVIIALNDVVINEVVYKAILEGDDNFKVIFQQNPVKGITEFAGIIKFVLKFVALLAFVAFIWGGGLFLVSFGDEEKVASGKKIMIDALIGLIVILISFALVSTLITGQVYQT